MASTAPKKYGLIIPPKRKKPVAVSSAQKPSVFGDSSSDEETDNTVRSKVASRSLWRENKKNAQQMESHQSVLKALEDDPSVFEYDSIYDDMQEKKIRSDPRLAKKDRSSKYIERLKKVAERRKVEQDIIYERKVQREMEREGKEYGDKDTFLTSAYRKKLEERKILEKELEMEAKREAANDVTKQVDMSRFHRTLLHCIAEPGSEVSTAHKSKASSSTSGGGQEEKEEDGARERRRSSDGDRRSGKEEVRQRLEEDTRESPETMEEQEEEARIGQTAPAEGEDDRGPAEVNDGERTGQASSEVPASVELFPPTVDKEARRRVAATKRANEETVSSAKERYLARKRAKVTAPIISEDD